MKKMWNMLRGKARRDNRGMSFVEVLCAVAILSLVAGVIGTVVVVSTRTYNRGISETNIQQEAQLAANNIGNMVKDACSVRYSEPSEKYGQYLENGTEWLYEGDGTTPKKRSDGITELAIITNDKKQYTIMYQRKEPSDPLGYLFYREDDVSDINNPILGTPQIMANNIVAFTADTTDFKNSKTIKLNMTVEDKSTNRKIPMEYTMTSRNDAVEGAVYVSHADSVALMFEESEVVLVPGEIYRIPLVVAGNLTEGIDWVSWGALETVSLTLDYAEVKVPVGTTSTSETITVRTKDKDEDNNYKATASCTVLIRRVENVQVTHSVDTTNSTGGMYETAGTVYTFTASVIGNELAKRVAYDYDLNYKTAQAVTWSYVLKINEVDQTAQFGDYFEIDTAKTKEDALVPSFVIKAKKAMPASMKLTVRATSKHASGVNKANSDYYDGLGIDPKNIYYGEDTLEPRETVLNKDLEIILEPQEKGRVALGMKGGLTSDLKFQFNGAKDLYNEANNPKGTRADYDASKDEVVITLGKDERGSGYNGADPYTFTIDVFIGGELIDGKVVGGTKKTTITVHVCRVDALSIGVIDNFTDNKGNVMGVPTYDFRARFNVTTGINDDIMQKAITHLIQYKEDGTPDKDVVKNTLSSKITWELFDYSASGSDSKPKYSGSVICMAGVGASDTGEIIGTDGILNNYEAKKDGYYQIVNIKPSRIEQKADGSWYIKQLPEIDVKALADTDTGLPANCEFKVTIEALHPLGTLDGTEYNKTGLPYGEAKDSVSIKGELTINTPKKVVFVEPRQGTDNPAQSDNEMVVPIEVRGGAVYRMEAKISGNSSKDTRLSNYATGDPDTGKDNPYMSEGATSANQMRVWYMGLVIGKDEKGNSNGRIQVHIDAYGTNNKLLAKTDFELGVRRVDKVDVKLLANSQKMEDINKAENVLKFEAYPKGRGSNGTEFYNKQMDENDEICRWEKEGHGEYKEPSPMEWKMEIKGTEKLLTEWKEYIDATSIKTSVNESDHKATIEFKLKQPIPNGAKIRAYSLHARGKVGDTKYNKSGEKYSDVYGEFSFEEGLIVVSSEWKRGGTNNISYNIPEKNITLNPYDPNDTKEYIVDDNGNILWGANIASKLTFLSKYNNQATGNNILEDPDSYISGGVGGTRGLTEIEPTNKINEFWATLYGKNETLDDGKNAMEKYAFSSPYPNSNGVAWWLDLSEIVVRVQIGVNGYGNFGNSDAVLEAEAIYSVADVVFQYANAPDAGSKWTNKGNNNALKVYVTPDDTMSEYKSYYWLSEGWDDEAEQEFDVLTDRYVGVINDSDNDSDDERLFDFTAEKGMDKAGRCWVSFKFPDSVKKEYANKNKVVKMTYEYNPFLCNTSNNVYGLYQKSELDNVDGCEGIIEFCFVKSNISGTFGGTKPSVMYCPTKAEVESTANPGDYYISTIERFHFNSETQVSYQTYSGGKWKEQAKMTYNGSSWAVE